MDITGIYLFDQNMGTAFVKARCTHIPSVLIFLGEMQLSVVKSRSALSPLASCSTYRQTIKIWKMSINFLIIKNFNTSYQTHFEI